MLAGSLAQSFELRLLALEDQIARMKGEQEMGKATHLGKDGMMSITPLPIGGVNNGLSTAAQLMPDDPGYASFSPLQSMTPEPYHSRFNFIPLPQHPVNQDFFSPDIATAQIEQQDCLLSQW
jgi:hypothetical protein